MRRKICIKCKREKLLSKFYKNKSYKSGFGSKCKECRIEYSKKYYKNNKIKMIEQTKKRAKTPAGRKIQRKINLKRSYGLTLDEHRLMYVLQNGKCAICKELVSYDKICTDHNHKTGKVRGLLCHRCNMWLAPLDDENFMKYAKKYLKKG